MTDQTEDIGMATEKECSCVPTSMWAKCENVCVYPHDRWDNDFPEMGGASNRYAYTHSNSPVGRLFEWGDGYTLYQIFIIFRDKNGKFQNPKLFIERHSKCRYLTSSEVTLHTYANNCGFSTTYIPNYIPYPKGLVNKDNILNEILKRD